MNNTEISVIIPTYNRAHLLSKAVESVLNQSRLPKEIVIVDDGSTDETEYIVRKNFKYAIIPIKYIKQTNRGPAAARNTGIKNISSSLIAFLDSDDSWAGKKLELQAAAMEKNEQYNISHTMEKWYRRGKHLNQKKKHQPPNGEIFEKCLALCCVGMSTVMIRRNIFGKYGLFDEKLMCCEDYDYWLRLAVNEEFLLVGQRLTIKDGGREDQVSAIYGTGMDRFRIMSIRNLLKQCTLNDKQKFIAKNMLRKKCQIYGNGCIKHGRTEEGRYILSLSEFND